MSAYLTLALFLGFAWFAWEVNAEQVQENRSYELDRWKEGIDE